MNTCHDCQAKLLNHLYGLLDDADERGVQDHLKVCEPCRAALATAQQQRQLIAFAAKGEFPKVRFAPPAQPVAEPTEAAAVPLPQRSWQRWAIAAGVALAVVGLGLAGGVSWYNRSQDADRAEVERLRVRRASEDLAQRQRLDRERARLEMEAIQEEIRLLETRWDGEVQKVRRASDDKDVQVTVIGPRAIQAGAPNVYQIDVHRQKGQPRDLTARILDTATKKELARQPLKGARTEWKLPENLPVTPGAQLALVVSDDGEGGVTRVNETLQLVSSLFITHLTTDRPLYRPGEVVRFRSLTLERFSLKPGKEDFQLRYRITDPRSGEVFKLDGVSRVGATPASPDRKVGGGEIVGPDGKAIRGIGAGEWRIPPEAAGGEYILTVSEAHNRFPPERRKFLVNQYQAPRLNKELDFTRRSYGPGDVVEVNCKVARVEGGLPGNEPVIATAQVDGQPCVVLDDGALRLNQGAVTVRFKLPAQIERGDGSVSIQFKDGGTHETLVRPIPIVLKKLFVEFFPEGGYLIAGVPNRVYFTARTTLGKPAELQGRLVGPDGKEVIAVRTLNDDKEAGVNQGMGVFEFTPQAGKVYDLKIDSPIGIESRHQLRDVNDSGVALAIPDGVFTKDLDVVLHSAGATRKLLVGAYCRGRLLAQSSVTAKDRELIKVKLTPAAGVGGVYRVTVFEEVAGSGDPATTRLQARAERLVYRQPVERLNLNVQAGKESYAPGEQGTVAIKATDENGQPAPFIALVSVVDLSVLKLADEKTARSMPTHFFLTTEVRQPEDLEYADFLVGPHPKATAALDLLLGTQGWRRFAEQKKPGDLREEKQNAERLLVATGQTAPEERNLAQLQLRKVDHDFAPQWVEKQTTLATREAQAEEAAKQASREQAEAQQRAAQAAQAAEFATTRLKEHNQRLLNYALIGLAVVLLGVGVWGLVVGMIRMSNNHPRAVPSFVTGICSLSVLFLVGLGVGVYFLANQPRVGQMEMAGARMQAGGGGMAGMPFGNAPPQPMAMPDMGMDVPKEAAKEKMAFDPFMQVPMPAREDKKKDDRGAEQAPRERPEVVLLNDDFKFGNKKDKEALGDEALVKPGKDLAPFVAKRRPRPPMEQPPGMPGMPLGGEGKRADWDDAEGLPGGQGPGQWRAVEERRLRKEGKLEEIAQMRLGLQKERAAILPTATPFVVREYAHKHLPAVDNVRRDFTETLYWHPVLVVPGGKKTDLTFELSDSVTRFQVQVWAHTLDGRLGSGTAEVTSKLPFSVEPTMPFEVTRSDKITIPVIVANRTQKSLSVELGVDAKNLTLQGDAKRQLAVDAGKSVRQLFTFQPSVVEGEATLNVVGRSEPLGADRVERRFKIVPEGFPVVGAKSDLLETVARHEIVLPEDWVKGTLKMQVQVFPSTLADLQKGLEGLLREPGGCFEQSSSSNYPNVLILNYLKASEQTDPQIEKRARTLLTSGYQQLTSFECQVPNQAQVRRGYEWFGQTAPPHEALTAYGLLQFKDMAKVHPVDAAMVERTRKYLLDQRDGKGGFKRNQRALDTFGRAPEHVTNAYIVWSLTEAGGDEDLTVELKTLHEAAKSSKDPYFVALVGLAHLNRGKSDEGLALLKAMRTAQQADGRLTGAQMSITGSGGRDLDIETTALATLAWLRANRPADFNENVQKAAKWIGQQRGGYGGFGSTQSTILALKALIAFTHDNKKVPVDSELVLEVNGKRVSKKFAAGSRDELVLALPDGAVLKPGKNVVSVSMEKNALPYTLTWSYRTLKPANVDNPLVQLTTSLDRNNAVEGETVRLKAVVTNTSGKGQGMAVAILGLPGGLEVPAGFRQLKNMASLQEDGTKPGEISAFEVRSNGRELVLYWRDLAPDKRIEVNVDLVCRQPGEYRGPASRAYLYYNADHKFWVEPLNVTIAPKAE